MISTSLQIEIQYQCDNKHQYSITANINVSITNIDVIIDIKYRCDYRRQYQYCN